MMEPVGTEALYQLWWVWGAGAVILAILEIFAPGFILLGFAIGAGAIAILLGMGGPAAAMLDGSFPMLMLFFAIFSLIAWIALRRFAGVRKGQIKVWDRDINED